MFSLIVASLLIVQNIWLDVLPKIMRWAMIQAFAALLKLFPFYRIRDGSNFLVDHRSKYFGWGERGGAKINCRLIIIVSLLRVLWCFRTKLLVNGLLTFRRMLWGLSVNLLLDELESGFREKLFDFQIRHFLLDILGAHHFRYFVRVLHWKTNQPFLPWRLHPISNWCFRHLFARESRALLCYWWGRGEVFFR